MKHVHLRRFGGVAAATVAAGLLATPTVAVADAGPAVLGTSQGVDAQHLGACGPAGDPAWIGRSVNGPALNVKVAGTGARFGVWDVTTGAEDPVFTGEAQANGAPQAGLTVPGLLDGHSYAWHAWALQGAQVSAPSADCHFTVDTTSPTATVSSTDFPASGTAPKFAGQVGTFVVRTTDPVPAGGESSGIACIRYGWGNLGVGGCDSPDAVVPEDDGTATVSLRVLNWGTNTLNVQVIDDAGNVGGAGYTFYAPSNPNPPKAPGDVDGDGVPDVLLPDAAGNLQIISSGSGDTTPSAVIRAVQSPNQTSWSNVQVAHRGWDANMHAPMDDLLMHPSGSPALYFYSNQDYASFTGYPSAISRPSACQNAAGTAAACPAGFATDWHKADQIALIGSLDSRMVSSLMTVEDGNLWLFANPGFSYRLRTARQLTTDGAWAGYDLVAPGPDAAGNLALWARDRATGELHAYPIAKKADGTFDFSALADPKAGVVASGFTVDKYPTLGSSGDVDGDGKPDLWAVTADRHLVYYSGWSDPSGAGALK
ncbi:hypothetical protein ACFY2K_32695 [Kitasatospora sp. NPDC001309]|uniref:hypothetical protein n=1 Tax=Kitasatospora sp. NPDC001309 TaxID=3364013 RepID=UPI00367452A3